LTQLFVEKPSEAYPLAVDTGLLLPVDPELNGIDLFVDAEENTTLELELWDTGRGENYVPHTRQLATLTPVAKGAGQFVRVNLHWKPDTPQNAFLVIKANKWITLHLSDEPQFGVLSFAKGPRPVVSPDLGDHQPSQPVVQWNMRPFNRKPICFRLLTPTQAFAADKVIDGFHRPFAGPHLWSSATLRKDSPEWLELNWPAPVSIRTVHITFNDDVNEDLINLHHHRTTYEVIPELVKDYLVQIDVDGEWITVAEGRNNRKRRVVHSLDQLVTSKSLRVVVEATNGCQRVEIFEIRVYE
jgi:hypothetical protein